MVSGNPNTDTSLHQIVLYTRLITKTKNQFKLFE